MDNKKIIYGIGALLIVVVIGAFFFTNPEEARVYDEFAQCIADTETTFWGAWWCPNCNDQKAMFRDSAKILPYVECSSPDRQTFYEECAEAEIEAFPTWDFPDGSREVGALSLELLADKTGCELPVLE